MAEEQRSSATSSPDDAPGPANPDQKPNRIRSEALLQGGREVIIEHSGQDYRLRITSSGKLILTK